MKSAIAFSLALATCLCAAACDMFVDDDGSGDSDSPYCEEYSCSDLTAECYEEQIPWSSTSEVAECDVVVDYVNPDNEECPADFGDIEPIIDQEVGGEGEGTTHVYCQVPKLPSTQSCADQTETQSSAIESEFGWYYCENLHSENFPEACADGDDNDADGYFDCDDSECVDCEVCPGGTGINCADTCKYVVRLSVDAEASLYGQNILVVCPKS